MLLFLQKDIEITQDYLCSKVVLIDTHLIYSTSIHYTTKYQINNQRRELKTPMEKIENPLL